ncbi:MAG TPA: hypothetical protein VL284_13245, partial [Thermoanaerobaculia bacterium]|nr:hypothetical protein [Thermoanaerobaculia bacterium]
MMRELWLKIGETSGARVYSLFTSLLVLTITARWLGPAGRGEIAASLVWANLFYVCGYMSLNLVAMHIAGDRGDEILPALFGTLLFVAFAVTVAGWIVANALFLFHRVVFGEIRASVLAIAFAALPFLILEQYGNGLLLATNRLRVYNRAIMIGKTLVFVCVGIAYLLGFDIRAAIAATVIGQVALVVTSAAPLVRASAGRMTFDGQILKKLLIGAQKLHPSTVSNFVYAYVGVLVMNRYLGPSQTGIYQFAVQLFEVMLVVPYAANIVLFAKTGETGVHNAWPYQRRVLLMLVGVMAGAGIVAAVAAPFAIPLVGGRAFLPSVSPFRHLLIALCFLTVSAVMTSQWIGRGLFLPLSILNIAYVAISLAANLILTPRFGMSGAVASLIL